MNVKYLVLSLFGLVGVSVGQVIQTGQCQTNIPLITNFDASRFLGPWNEVVRASNTNQGCGNIDFTLISQTDTTVQLNFVSSMVRNTNRYQVRGTSTHQRGTSRFTVNLAANVGFTIDYWVIATDFTSYALVYSCRNIDTTRREVHSWTLSRTATLTASSVGLINTVIINANQQTRELIIIAGSDGTCFSYPQTTSTEIVLAGECVADNLVQAVTNFNITEFSGTWFEVARFPSELQNGECASSEYTVRGTNTLAINKHIIRNERQHSLIIPSASATDGGRGVITATGTGLPFTSFYILGTDYNEFALAYACRNLGNNRKQIYSWKLSRNRDGLSQAANNAINTIVANKADLFEPNFRYTDLSNRACFHYPDFAVLPNEIILPGPCDTRIRGISAFNANAYLGRWFEVARFPQPTQRGQCNRAEYTLGTGVVNVVNSQVLDRSLDTISGTAIVASADGSGMLNVSFVVGGQVRVANYYILATDYTNYALVYNCHDLDNGNRRVGSWKLSRTTSLSDAHLIIMDNVIAATEGLRQEYYQTTSQTDAACFFVPQPNRNQAPLFRGRCETLVPTIRNFNITQYAGWWHEIESYGVDGGSEDCISSLFQVTAGLTTVTDTSITNGTATIVTGTVVATADGRLTRTLANGQTQEFWVLDTDYNTYSLLYSCVNVGTEYRRVWSAKHSKTRQLTQAAQDSMAVIINANQVLEQRLYFTVDQSDRACFHLPAQTGNQIILPGQCDLNITVVQNFDIAAYGGTWYQIERYPQLFESGVCTGARYILDEAAGRVSVLNWEVVNGTLRTISGSAVPQFADGSARLTVTLQTGPERTVTTSLYVLATDYRTFSLAYSCANINSFQRSIGAWKLSRTRTMPAAGNTAIDAVIQQREELHQPFFRQNEQRDDCEEPSSGLIVKSSIIMLLVCTLLHLFY